jgi:ribosomal protein S18 acetylase RimI-like enzyme
MYVAPGARRRGHARTVLAHLEATAREAGADVMVLETGTAQPEAIRMYLEAGYEPIDKFGHYAWSPKSRCFGKRL